MKNKSLNLSIDFANYSQDLYRTFFNRISEYKDLQPKKILDIGCDNGIVTCFLGTLFPQAEVIGIDKNISGIECARQLADKLGLQNISFHVYDFAIMDRYYDEGSFDMLISVRSFHEIIGHGSFGPYWTLSDVFDEIKDQEPIEVLKQVHYLLNDNGIFIAWERFWYEDVLRFIENMKKAGLYIVDDLSCIMDYHELGEPQRMPLFVFSKRKNDKSSLESTYELHMKAQNSGIYNSNQFDGLAAEYVFENKKEKKLKYGVQIVFSDQSGKLRLEIWECNNDLLLYEYSNLGYRKLRILKSQAFDIAQKELKEMAEYYATGNKVFNYTTPEERSKLE